MRWYVIAVAVALLALVTRDASARSAIEGPVFYRFGDPEPASAWTVDERPSASWSEAKSMLDVPQRGESVLWLAIPLPKELG